MPTLGELKAKRYAALTEAARQQYDKRRGSSDQRGYGHAWAAIRRRFIQDHPVCAVAGCGRPSVEVDHIKPRRDGGSDDDSNLEALCKTHHSQKTAANDGGFGNVKR